MKIKSIFTLVLILGAILTSNAQVENTTEMCAKHLVHPFVSDGQQYRALLNGDEIAEFHATFYGGSTYRISSCSGSSEGNLIFSVYDKERNQLFTNRDYQNSPYWDFKFNSTMECIIEAELEKKEGSGFAILLIGFKQK
jgi:hypothetical protein